MIENGKKVHLKMLGTFILGVFLGGVTIILAGWFLMPKMMLTVRESPYDVEKTCEMLRKSIQENGWNCPAVRNMNQAMAKEGINMESPVCIVELCKADYARDVLQTNPEVSTLMPCAWGVYKKNGRVYVTGMNMGLMGKIFGGNIAQVMGRKVSIDEHKILEILK